MALMHQTYRANSATRGGSANSVQVLSPQRKVSSLAQLQARFQQKQLQEKEQKLLALYESQTQRAFQRVGRGSAGSSSSSSSSVGQLGAGKVRQLFDERRSKTSGWDRSYPLEPLDNKVHSKATRGVSLDRTSAAAPKQVARRSRSQVRSDNNNLKLYRRFDESDDVNFENYIRNYRHSEKKDRNYNNIYKNYAEEEFEDGYGNDYAEERPRDVDFDSSYIYRKLPNIGGLIDTDKTADKYKTYNADERRRMAPPTLSAAKASASSSSSSSPIHQKPTKPISKKTEVKQSVSHPSQPAPTSSRRILQSSPEKSLQQGSQSVQGAMKPLSSRNLSTTPQRTISEKNAPKISPSSKKSNTNRFPGSVVVRDDLHECKYCGRRFTNDRIIVHEKICSKTVQKKRKIFDPSKQRVHGTEAESFVRKGIRSDPPKDSKKSNWRKQHEEFINNIRAAKLAQAHVAAGGKLADLPPPPPLDTSDYIQCPHCGRRFNEAAAERHIPKCANMLHNKPKPSSKKR